MKHLILSIVALLAMFSMQSCLTSGLDDIEDSNLCELTSISMEHRWLTQNANGYDQLSRQQLTLDLNTPDSNGMLRFSITVPEASNSFPQSVKESVTLDNLYLIAIISPAAKIQPVDDAPTLGLPAKWELNHEYKYKVTAANGNSKTYTLVIEGFNN